MQAEARLPQTKIEGILFMLIISFLSVNTIAPTIMALEKGFSKAVYIESLKIIPIMWIIVIFIVRMIAGPLGSIIMNKFVGKTDGFNARILLNTLINVTIISLLMTFVGRWVGTQTLDLEPFKNFIYVWPRNFGIAFWIEILFAQPIAWYVMTRIHNK